jgi:ABC-2 type transport system ATP-binding protein
VRRQRTTEPGRFVAELVAREGEVAELEVIRPSLEDIYLGLVEAADAADAATVASSDLTAGTRASAETAATTNGARP